MFPMTGKGLGPGGGGGLEGLMRRAYERYATRRRRKPETMGNDDKEEVMLEGNQVREVELDGMRMEA
jgi:hypothetical protein